MLSPATTFRLAGFTAKLKSGVGALGVSTVKDELLVAEPLLLLTVMGPEVAPAGTVAIICVAVTDVTVALAPFKETAF